MAANLLASAGLSPVLGIANGSDWANRRFPTKERDMYEDTDKFVDLNFEQNVRQAAYLLWEKDGRPFGSEKEYWFKALEAQLAARDKANRPPKPAND